MNLLTTSVVALALISCISTTPTTLSEPQPIAVFNEADLRNCKALFDNRKPMLFHGILLSGDTKKLSFLLNIEFQNEKQFVAYIFGESGGVILQVSYDSKNSYVWKKNISGMPNTLWETKLLNPLLALLGLLTPIEETVILSNKEKTTRYLEKLGPDSQISWECTDNSILKKIIYNNLTETSTFTVEYQDQKKNKTEETQLINPKQITLDSGEFRFVFIPISEPGSQ